MKRLATLLLALVGLSLLAATAPSDRDFVDVATAVPGIRVELPYATEANFLHRKIYSSGRGFVRRGTAAKLARAQAALAAQGLGLKVLDGYRPPAAQKLMWRILPDSRYVANPANGSRHQRGAAVDVTLVTADGSALEMPTAFDDFTSKAAASAPASPAATRHRKILQQAMTAAGFAILATEWWHFDDSEWRRYPLADVSAEDLEARADVAATPRPATPDASPITSPR